MRARLAGVWVVLLLATLAPPATAHHAEKHVLLKDTEYSPKVITVDIGDTVTWTHAGGTEPPHSVTADEVGAPPGDSCPPAVDGCMPAPVMEYTYKFTEAGTYPYHCRAHPTTMKGEVEVRAAAVKKTSPPPAGGGGGATTPPPPGQSPTGSPSASPSPTPTPKLTKSPGSQRTLSPGPEETATEAALPDGDDDGGPSGALIAFSVALLIAGGSGAGLWWIRRRASAGE